MKPGEYLIGVFLLIGVSALGLTQLAAGLAGLWDCGAWPPLSGFFGGFSVLGGAEGAMVNAAGCAPTQVSAIVAMVAVLLVAAVIGFAIVIAVMRWRESERYFIGDLRRRRGFARGAEVSKFLGARAAQKRARTLRPQLGKKATAQDVAWKVGSSRGIETFVSIEDSVIVIGPPRSGKGFRFIINAILDWPGPLITTSTRNDNLAATMAMRQQMGTVTVFDPQKLSGIRSTLRISPMTGCEDPMVAEQRAAALVHGSGLGASSNNQEWAGAAREVLAQLLLAAAVDGRTVRDLARWGGNPELAREAVDILEQAGPPGWSTSLDAVLGGDEKLLANKWFGVSGAVAPLRIPQIAEAMTPLPGEDVFDPIDFLSGRNTLYLIGTRSGAGSAGGYLAALMDDIVEQARRRALSLPGSRLDPPLGLILDEIANIFSWPSLPTIMADGGGIGISPLVVLQARTQAETAWSRAEMDSVFSAATAKMLLGGSSDVAFLRDMQELLGQRELDRKTRSWSESGTSMSKQSELRALITPEEMRRMPQSIGLLSYRNVRPVLLDLDAWIDRDDAKAVKRGKRETERGQQLVFAEQEAQRRAAYRRTDEGDPA